MNKTTLSEKIKQLGLRLFEDKTASELEYIIKEIFPNAKILTDFLSYKDNLGKITLKSMKIIKMNLEKQNYGQKSKL